MIIKIKIDDEDYKINIIIEINDYSLNIFL